MSPRRAILLGFDDTYVTAAARHGIETLARIGSHRPSGNARYEFIDHKSWVRYRYDGRANEPPPADLSADALKLCGEEFRRCVDRYGNASALICDYTDYDLLFEKALRQAYALLSRHRPDLLFCANVLHRCATVALFACARAMGIRTAVCIQSQFPNRLFIVDDWRDFGVFASSRRGPTVSIDTEPPERMPFYMNRLESPSRKALRAALRFAEFYVRLLPAPAMMFGKRGQSRINRLLDEMRNAVQMTHFASARAAMRPATSAVLSGEFVYFPLHLQPEMTTDVLGGKWSNQPLALRWLRQFVPSRIPIVVKENPKQDGLMRSPLFWETIASLENVFFAEDRASSIELVRSAKLTATITGTAGWEALRCGRPALAFGNVFWRHMHGAFHVEDNPQWSSVAEFRFDSRAFLASVENIGRFTYGGVADVNYAAIVPGFDVAANGDALACSLVEHLSQD